MPRRFYTPTMTAILLEEVLDLVFPGLALRAVLGAAFGGQAFEVAQHVLLLLGQLDRRLDGDVAEQIARVAGTHALDALALQAEGLARLRALGYRERHLAGQRRHFDFTTQGRLAERDRHFAMQVVAFALEHGVRLDVDFHIQIARRAAIGTRFAVAGRADAHAVVDADRDLHFQRLVALDATGAAARCARIGDDLAGAVAFRAGLLDAEEALLHAHLAVAAASRAGARRGARLGAGAVAGVALVPGRHADGRVEAVGGLLQRDFQVVAQVGAAIHLRSGVAAAAATQVRIDAGVTVTVIGLALFRIGQHLVRFFDFLEFFFRLFAVRIAVRMVLHRQFAIRLLDLVFRRIFCDTKCLVEITLCHVVGTLLY